MADELGRSCNLGTTRTMANAGLLGSYYRARSLQVVAPVATPVGSPALVQAFFRMAQSSVQVLRTAWLMLTCEHDSHRRR